jgi:lipoprotein NlpI
MTAMTMTGLQQRVNFIEVTSSGGTSTMRSGAQQDHAAVVPRRRSSPRAHAIIALLLAGALAGGCTSFQGARLYRSGTRALDSGNIALAVAHFERAAVLVPQGSEIQNHLGLAYAAAGRPDAARAAYRRAVELDCDNAAAQHNLEVAERLATLELAP